MAGSYKHIMSDDGLTYRGVELLEHLGDADEALEECWEMLQYLSGGDKVKIHEAYVQGYFKKHCPKGNIPPTFDQFFNLDN